jgi:hypothetical protein
VRGRLARWGASGRGLEAVVELHLTPSLLVCLLGAGDLSGASFDFLQVSSSHPALRLEALRGDRESLSAGASVQHLVVEVSGEL